MKKLILGLGSIASVVAPVQAVISSGEHETRASVPLTTDNVYQWGVQGYTMDHPLSETLTHYIDRKKGTLARPDKEAVLTFLSAYHSTHPTFRYFVGTTSAFDIYKQVLPYREKADRGQEVENAIELNKAIANFIEQRIRHFEGQMFGALRDLTISHLDITAVAKYNSAQPYRLDYINRLDQINNFELDIAIATNTDPTHPVDWLEETEFTQTLEDISNQDNKLWLRITKILNVEEAYEPENIVAKYKEIQLAVNNHIVAIYQASHTLAGEMANAGA